MINTELVTLMSKPDAAEALQKVSSGQSSEGVQATELEELNFNGTLQLQLHNGTGADELLAAGRFGLEQSALANGKELPSLPLSAAVMETKSAALAGPATTAVNEVETDQLLSTVAVMLPAQMQQEGPAGNRNIARSRQSSNELQVSVTSGEKIRAEALLSNSADNVLIKPDINLKNPDSTQASSTLLEHSAESPSLAQLGTAAKAATAEVDSRMMGPGKLSINVPVQQQAAWGENIAGRVTWMLMNNQQSAQISLNPAELGPIEVKISLQNDQASVNFYAHNGTVRDAIEEAFPRLRDMLNENGMNLSQSSVSDQSLSQKQGQGGEAGSAEQAHYPYLENGPSAEQGVNEVITVQLGLVDHFV